MAWLLNIDYWWYTNKLPCEWCGKKPGAVAVYTPVDDLITCDQCFFDLLGKRDHG